jgi:hypothetical protein
MRLLRSYPPLYPSYLCIFLGFGVLLIHVAGKFIDFVFISVIVLR